MLAQENVSAVRMQTVIAHTAVAPLLRRIFIPREHGSWGMWLLPLLSGAVVGSKAVLAQPLPILWFLAMSVSAFLAYQPLEVLLALSPLRARTPRERNLVGFWVLVCATMAFLSLDQLRRLGRPGIIWFAVLGALCFAVRWLFGSTRAFRTSKQIMGSLALTSTAAGSYYAVTGALSREGLILWLAFWLFSAAQIEFVQLCIRTANIKSRTQKLFAGRTVLIFHVGLFLEAVGFTLAGFTPALFSLVFVPALIRIVLWVFKPPQKINFRNLGFAELFQNVLFASLVSIAFVLQ